MRTLSRIRLFTLLRLLGLSNMLFRTTQNQNRSLNYRSASDTDKIHLYHFPNPLNASEHYEVTEFMQNTKLEKGKQNKIVLHGFGGHCFQKDVPFRIIKAYLRAKARGHGDYNVLCLDYGRLSFPFGSFKGDVMPFFRELYEYVCDIVSEKAVHLILKLEEHGYASSLNDIHIIGNSLGGQISGYIGRKVQEQTGKSIGRITGLDIANLFFLYSNQVSLHIQLDLSDANFVDIIHTSPIGLAGDYGHVDFYPDGGVHQRSCLAGGPASDARELFVGFCSHLVAGKYWESSIDASNIITACKDDSWEGFQKKRSRHCKRENSIIFGEYVSNRARGKYFFEYPLIKQ